MKESPAGKAQALMAVDEGELSEDGPAAKKSPEQPQFVEHLGHESTVHRITEKKVAVQRKINVWLPPTDKIGERGQQLIFTTLNIDFKKDGGRGGPAGFKLLQASGLSAPGLIGLGKKTARHRIAGPVLRAHDKFA
jgi:hypothetical protein